MNDCAPNLTALIGEQVGARLISHAGSLTNLAKAPASTVQILGAEKALFRALKTRGKTPKYGLIFHSSFIGRAGAKNKGRISRYLANKCSLASRIDSFGETVTDKFGENFKSQVEERLEFYKSGKTPRKNQEVMSKAITEASEDKKEEKTEVSAQPIVGEEKEKKKKKKKKEKEAVIQGSVASTPTPTPTEPKKKRNANVKEFLHLHPFQHKQQRQLQKLKKRKRKRKRLKLLLYKSVVFFIVCQIILNTKLVN